MDSQFSSIHKEAKDLWASSSRGAGITITQLRDILSTRKSDGLDVEQCVDILKLLEDKWNNNVVASYLIEEGTKLRKKLFGNKVFVMAPIEVSNRCASNCSFCGWRCSNLEMKRRRISKRAFIVQVEYLFDLGIRHIEIVGGDDTYFVGAMIPKLIQSVKRLASAKGIECDVSICTMALPEQRYREFAGVGLDAVITWQETYDPLIYNSYIKGGPKAHAIDDDLNIIKGSDGYVFRLESQARACNANLQVGLGAMLGLSTDLSLDIVSTIIHANTLIKGRFTDKPLIIGTPTLNTIISKTVNAPLKRVAEYQHSYSNNYVALSALYLLANPDRSVWVFPNCRIPKEVQTRAIVAAGYFTSTQVRLGPGGYLLDMLNTNKYSNIAKEILSEEYGTEDAYTMEQFLESEQFEHHYHSHGDYVQEFRNFNIEVKL